MKHVTILFLSLLWAASARADQANLSRAQMHMRSLQESVQALAREADRDAEVLRVLVEAGRAMDDWQKNNAIASALERVTKAEQYVRQPPPADFRIRNAVSGARELLEKAKESPSMVDLQQTRNEFHRRSVGPTREVVAKEIHDLAQLSTQLADASALISRALAGATSAALSRVE